MNHQITENGQMLTVKLKNKLYVQDAAALKDEVDVYLNEKSYDILFDLTELSYIDSSGLGVIIAIYKKVVKLGGNVKIQGLNGTVKELFQMTRLTNFFEIIN